MLFPPQTTVTFRTKGRGILRVWKGKVIAYVVAGKLPDKEFRLAAPHGTKPSNRDRYLIDIGYRLVWANVQNTVEVGQTPPAFAGRQRKPVVKKVVTKKPVTKKPVAKKPVAKKPVAKKPVAKKPVAKKPVAKKVVAKKPVAKKIDRSPDIGREQPMTSADTEPVAASPPADALPQANLA